LVKLGEVGDEVLGERKIHVSFLPISPGHGQRGIFRHVGRQLVERGAAQPGKQAGRGRSAWPDIKSAESAASVARGALHDLTRDDPQRVAGDGQIKFAPAR
jgi:hypothetical protein